MSPSQRSQAAKMPQVAVIVVNYNGAGFLADFASSFGGLSYANKRLWLVDNASTDGSERLLPELFPEAEIILNTRNDGFAAAVNRALGRCLATGPEFVLLLNPDTTLDADCLDRLVTAADGRTLAGAKVLAATDGRLATHAGRFSWWRGYSVDTHEAEPPDAAFRSRSEVDGAGFVCMLIPAAAFRAVGAFDERFGMYVEDTDFCIRARRAGFRIVIEPGALVRHLGRASSGANQSEFFHYYATRNRAYLLSKHTGLRSPVHLASYLWFSLADVKRFKLWRQRSVVRARLAGLRDFFRGRMGMTYEPHDFGLGQAADCSELMPAAAQE